VIVDVDGRGIEIYGVDLPADLDGELVEDDDPPNCTCDRGGRSGVNGQK
jgi:hypothetical protein